MQAKSMTRDSCTMNFPLVGADPFKMSSIRTHLSPGRKTGNFSGQVRAHPASSFNKGLKKYTLRDRRRNCTAGQEVQNNFRQHPTNASNDLPAVGVLPTYNIDGLQFLQLSKHTQA